MVQRQRAAHPHPTIPLLNLLPWGMHVPCGSQVFLCLCLFSTAGTRSVPLYPLGLVDGKTCGEC